MEAIVALVSMVGKIAEEWADASAEKRAELEAHAAQLVMEGEGRWEAVKAKWAKGDAEAQAEIDEAK